MLSQYTSQFIPLFKRLLFIYLIYFLCRLLFFVYNYSAFDDLGFSGLASIQFYGLRFDTFSIFVSNSLFILLSILPFNFINKTAYQKTLRWIYVLCNTVFILLNLIDVVYYPYIKKRSTADLLMQAGGQTDLSKLLPQYLLEYWYILLLLIGIAVSLFVVFNKTKQKPVLYSYSPKISAQLFFTGIFMSSLVVLGIRGGFQRVPIDVIDAGKYTQPKNICLLVNTPFTIIKSLEKEELKKLEFDFKETPVQTLYNPVNSFQADTFKRMNVVVLILESYAKEYTKLGHLTSYTPFFDSLMDQSLAFTNAYANGHKSIEGIPAILSSMPSLMENPFINSAYAGDSYSSLATLLKQEGYATSFFHGGINGTMNFDSYAMQAGYDAYYGRNEYGNEADFDGYWGIFDEPFYAYSVKKMSEMKEPFHAGIFSLSSHHPYVLPAKYKNRFPKGDLENHESIGYADYALRQFFENAKKEKWYANTLFVLVADHSSISKNEFFSNLIGQFSIPVLFYKPDGSLKGTNDRVFQQADILPSVLDILGYPKPFFSFGKSFKEENNRHATYYVNSSHYYLTDSLLLTFSNYELSSVFAYKKDSLMTQNILSKGNYEADVRRFRAFIQTYNNCLINNTCIAK